MHAINNKTFPLELIPFSYNKVNPQIATIQQAI